ncbi:hypothetical protein [Anaerocolumna sp.]|uniref:hypothetical protein n=1 Tax=Anaerocolumna sp. TaxID=2041569 RepID=UPI0028B1068C|nr:hypothetical protein [Anaerocolumna sp.]
MVGCEHKFKIIKKPHGESYLLRAMQFKREDCGGVTINRTSLSKRIKIYTIVLIAMLLIIVGIINRVNSHTVYSFKKTSLTLEQAQEECPHLLITDNEQLIAEEIMEVPDVQAALSEEIDVILDKSLIEELCNKWISDFKVYDFSVLGRNIVLDGHYANNRCILTFNGNGFIRKTISFEESKKLYENLNNEEIKKNTKYLNIIKSIFG